jgi:G6PDH family F420-dependent oxidoreductase
LPEQRIQLGYKLSSEEFSAPELVRQACAAEEHGFSFAMISDHYHPWTSRQGQSPFVWSVIGGIASTTRTLMIGTGVTCPTFRMHPAIVAQAAATAATMMPGRFFLGVGTGENLNEHIVGERWPEVEVRQQRLAEAIEIMRRLWEGRQVSFHGQHFQVENARLYSMPDRSPDLLIAAAGPRSIDLAAQLGDGLIATAPEGDLVRRFQRNGGLGKPCYGELNVCFDENERRAEEMAHAIWPLAGLPGQLLPELPAPSLFEKAADMISREKIASTVICGPDPDKHLNAIAQYANAGFDHVFVHQIGPNQEAFMDFYAREIMPRLTESLAEKQAA